jgi:hypothetical protein
MTPYGFSCPATCAVEKTNDSVCQTACRIPGCHYDGQDCYSGAPGRSPIIDAGLDGTGEIIGVTDSGLDVNHPFFYDNKSSVHFAQRDGSFTVPPR